MLKKNALPGENRQGIFYACMERKRNSRQAIGSIPPKKRRFIPYTAESIYLSKWSENETAGRQ
jgi:hypothetical protein